MKFKTTILQFGNNTGIEVPENIIEAFGVGKKPPVVVTLNNYSYSNTVAVMGGKYLIGLSAEHRKNADVKGGDTLDIMLELDTAPRIVEVPADLQKAFSKNKVAKTAYEKSAPGKKKALVLSINDAKTEETKIRRIDKALVALVEGKL